MSEKVRKRGREKAPSHRFKRSLIPLSLRFDRLSAMRRDIPLVKGDFFLSIHNHCYQLLAGFFVSHPLNKGGIKGGILLSLIKYLRSIMLARIIHKIFSREDAKGK